jgi:hypothetical protein
VILSQWGLEEGIRELKGRKWKEWKEQARWRGREVGGGDGERNGRGKGRRGMEKETANRRQGVL